MDYVHGKTFDNVLYELGNLPLVIFMTYITTNF